MADYYLATTLIEDEIIDFTGKYHHDPDNIIKQTHKCSNVKNKRLIIFQY